MQLQITANKMNNTNRKQQLFPYMVGHSFKHR